MRYSVAGGGQRSHDSRHRSVRRIPPPGAVRDLERRPELPVLERDRGRARRPRSRALVAAREGLAATLAAETTPLDAQRALVGLEVPDEGLPGPPPRGRLRAGEARRLRRLRRDLRQDVPALSESAVPAAGRGPELAPARRRLVVDAARDRGLGRRLRVRLRPVGARRRLLADRGDGDERHRVRRRGPVRRRRLRRERPAVAGDRAADGAAQRPPPPLLGGARAVAARTSRRRDGR